MWAMEEEPHCTKRFAMTVVEGAEGETPPWISLTFGIEQADLRSLERYRPNLGTTATAPWKSTDFQPFFEVFGPRRVVLRGFRCFLLEPKSRCGWPLGARTRAPRGRCTRNSPWRGAKFIWRGSTFWLKHLGSKFNRPATELKVKNGRRRLVPVMLRSTPYRRDLRARPTPRLMVAMMAHRL